MTWDYAELSKLAKTCGGPEQLVDSLVSGALKKGRSQMLPVIGGALVVGGSLMYAYQKLKEYFLTKHTSAEIEAAGEEIIQGINKYDAEHPDEETDNVNERKNLDE